MLTQEINKTKTVGDDGVSYPYGFRIWNKTDLRVIISNKVAPLEKDELTLDTDYTVAGVGLEDGGTITLIGNYAIGETPGPPDSTKYVTCIGELEYKQETGLSNQGVPEGNVLERMIDKAIRVCQQLKEQIDRCLKVDETSDEDPEDHTYESFVGTAPVDDSGFGGVLSGATATVQGCLDQLDTDAAPLASPALTGTPTAPTASQGTKTTQIATTAFLHRVAPVLLDSASPSGAASATVKSASVTDYDRLFLEVILTCSASCVVQLQFTDTAGNPLLLANYVWFTEGYGSDGSEERGNSGGSSLIQIAAPVVSGAITFQVVGEFLLDGIAAGVASRCHGRASYRSGASPDVWAGVAISGVYATGPQVLGGAKLSPSAGTITGFVRLWGLPKGS